MFALKIQVEFPETLALLTKVSLPWFIVSAKEATGARVLPATQTRTFKLRF